MKSLNDLYKKYEGLIKLIIIVVPLVFAAWKYLAIYIYLPDRMDAFEIRAKADSMFIMKVILRHDSIDRVHHLYLEDDYRNIDSIKTKLKRNKIK